MTLTEQMQEVVETLGGSNTPDNLISTKLNTIIELLGDEADSKLISRQLGIIIDRLKFLKEYAPIEYIESSGTQYIDTGFILKANDTIEVDVFLNYATESQVTVIIAGARSSLRVRDISIRTYSEKLGFVKNTSVNVESEDVSFTRHRLAIKGASYSVDGIMTTVPEWEDAEDCTYTCWLFGCNVNGRPSGTLKPMRFYSCKIWDGETLVRNFIPCVRKEDSVAGLFDKVNKVFHTNAGTGEFIVPE